MTTSPDYLTELFSSLGPASPDVAEVVEDAGGSRWVVLVRDLTVVFTLRADGRSLTLCTDLGRPVLARRTAVFEAMLLYASLHETNGGHWMALAAADDDCQLFRELPVEGLGVSPLLGALETFTAMAHAWRTVIEKEASEAAALVPDVAAFALKA